MASEKKTMLHTAAAMICMVFVLMPGMCSAQSDAWTWMSGSDQIFEFGVYGTQQVPNAANVPGAREDSSSWTDASGDLWLFGGVGVGAAGYGWLNDLWHYNSGTGEWTWMSGSNAPNQTGSYVNYRVADAANMPGARRGAASWIDANGDLWLFGGEGYDAVERVSVCHFELGSDMYGWLNDLWRYDTSIDQWVWEGGYPVMIDDTEKGHYDDKGYPDPSNWPGAREGAITWTDNDGFMWMFGGYGWQYKEFFETNDDDVWCWYKEKPCEECPDPGVLNDLWVYNRLTNEWAWVSGSEDVDQLGDYGTKGEATFSNMPGGRMGAITWIDTDNNLWLFGGAGKDSIGPPYPFVRRMNDLWRYDPDSKMWTWVSGSDIGDHIGIYNESNGDLIAGCREEAVSWIDEDDNLWLHGGFGQAGTYSPIGGLLNDQWFFNTAVNEWVWVSGSNEISDPNSTIVAGVYGTQGVADENNVTGARESAVPWRDSLGNVWLFGGWGFDAYAGYGSLNDLWSFGSRACANNGDCDDGLFCTGIETCTDGLCVGGDEPCDGDTPFCDDVLDQCYECEINSDCDDDLYCTGDETCAAGVCVDGTNPCLSGPDPVCDEADDVCVAIECVTDGDCDDGLFCTGDETCVNDVCVDGTNPCSGSTPVCDEIGGMCVAGCLADSDCDDAYFCQNEVCVPKCRLLIKDKKLSAAKLLKKNKDKKVTFKITTGDFGDVTMGEDIIILEVKPNTKKGTLKVKTLVPADIGSQTIPVWVGDCYGEIEILE